MRCYRHGSPLIKNGFLPYRFSSKGQKTSQNRLLWVEKGIVMDLKQLQSEQEQTKTQSGQKPNKLPVERRHLPPLVQDALALMDAEYAYLYGIEELADRLEVSKHHLIRVFSASMGISPGNYLIGVRISHAKLLLRSCEDTPIEIIAGACGYSCGNYFSKVFKKHTGLTPTQYMQSARQSSISSRLSPDYSSPASTEENADESFKESIEKIYL